MSTIDIQENSNVYSMFSFRDGRREPGMMINKYNLESGQIEHYFIHQLHMQAYKSAFEKYDRETCSQLSEKINSEDIISIRPVSLHDYKLIMELLHERNQLLNSIQ